jgi:hypothetical protein
MLNLCDEIEKKLSYLPPEDVTICKKYFEKRDFESILEIVESAIIMKKRDAAKKVHKKKWEDIEIIDLEELAYLTKEYLSYLNIDVENNEYYE